MDILQAFVLNDIEHNINILWKDDKPLFRASEIAKILDIKKIRNSIIDFDNDEKIIESMDTRGGQQKVIFLTEIGVYKLLMHSRKSIAKPFQKWVTQILVSIREKGKYELEIKLNNAEDKIISIQKALDDEAAKYKYQINRNKHDIIIEAYNKEYLVYIAKICQINDKFIIKIGSTGNIKQRAHDLEKQYGSFTLLQVFKCSSHTMFEKFLQKHSRIINFNYKEAVNNNKSNGELFLVDNDEINAILKIAKHNVNRFNNKAEIEEVIREKTIELEKIKETKELVKISNKKYIKEIIDKTTKEIKEDYQEYIDPIILYADKRNHTQVRGNKIQRYSPDGLNLLKTYESYAYAVRDKELDDLNITGIKNAIKNNNVYKNYRWFELDRELSDDTAQTLPETNNIKVIKIGYVAMLNINKDKIVKVFSDQKSVVSEMKFSGLSSISCSIKRGSLSRGHYFMMWNDCDQKLKDDYLLNNKLPDKRSTTKSKKINQLHPITKDFIKTFVSIDDVIKEFKISRATLKNAYTYDLICKGYRWVLV